VEVRYHPDFEAECRVCGASPCVVVDSHSQGDTNLCGPCFFGDRLMIDWAEWNNQEEPTE